MSVIPVTLTRDQVREIDGRAAAEYGISGLVLMENAGRGAADLLLRQGARGAICVCCGKGNNGGDGFVIARHLEAAGADVHVLLAADPEALTGDAAVNFAILRAAGTPHRVMTEEGHDAVSRRLMSAGWIVDALLGTGAQGVVRGDYATLIEAINSSPAPVLAVDLPSGLDCDLGSPLETCVRADLTATFVARKVGFDVPESRPWTGPVSVLPIGVPRQLLAAYNL
ncbi:MAG: NAD(P)H-hydrate epimerase [Planctomycetaceae bacterium]|nr:NAD(P)H-hydrate epimerase [Planctomycetaceae bacterium]